VTGPTTPFEVANNKSNVSQNQMHLRTTISIGAVPTSQQEDNHHNYTTNTGKMNNTYQDSLHEISNDSGDLSEWEYLTKTYDDPHMYTNYDDCIVPSNIADLNQHVSETMFGSITHPISVQDVNEVHTILPQYHPAEMPTPMECMQYTTSSSCYPDVSLLHHHDPQIQYPQHFKNHYLQQQHAVSSFATVTPPTDPTTFVSASMQTWTHPMRANNPGQSKQFTAPPITRMHSQNWSHPSAMFSQQRTSSSEEYFQQVPQSTSLHQQQQYQLQYQAMIEEPLQQHHYQPMNAEPPHQHAVPIPHEWFTSLPSSTTTDHVFSPSITVLDDFEPEPIGPNHMETMRLRTNTDTASSVTSINPSPTMCYSRKKALPRRSQQNGITGDNHDSAAPDEAVYHLELPSFVHQILPPYQQHQNARLLLRPLTPYNYFYRDERDNIVHNLTTEDDPLPPPLSDFAITKMHALLYEHWYVDPSKPKRSHRKSHGKVSFETLSKTIAQRWHNLPEEGREFYRNVSFLDNVYYQKELLKTK
jgi:hypothetical protein